MPRVWAYEELREEGKNHFSLSLLLPASSAVRLAVLLRVVYS